MIQFNLIPDVKKEYIKVKKTKRLIMSVSFLSAGIAVSIVVLLFLYVQVGQKSYINGLTADINSEKQEIDSIPDLDKILTIQNQLLSLPELHRVKPETSRVVNYLTQVTPVEVKISKVNIDVLNSTMEISGTGNSLAAVNKYADTLKFVEYVTEGGETSAKPFSTIITSLSRNEKDASYKITLVFDPLIFDNTVKVKFIVPTQVTTRSVVEKPELGNQNQENNLFEEPKLNSEEN